MTASTSHARWLFPTRLSQALALFKTLRPSTEK